METPLHLATKKASVNVVLFSGGRGSRVLSKQLINNPDVRLTLAVNGYDDGASTGEVRRFLGESLGPSDYRKNALRLARELRSCSTTLLDLLERRFPVDVSAEEAMASLRLLGGRGEQARPGLAETLYALLKDLDPDTRQALGRRIDPFLDALTRTDRTFSFSDCSLGNIVFAGCFLAVGRAFNAAIADYCALLHVPEDIILNVTDGTDAYLVALDQDYHFLGSEADIVDANRRNHINDIFLIDRPLTAAEQDRLAAAPLEGKLRLLKERTQHVGPNPLLLDRIAQADLIIYSPGTQYSSLFPSYQTSGLGLAIAQNLTAIKLLITNIQEDAEIPDSSALDILERAVYYLREKGVQQISPPRLITHYLMNDPGRSDQDVPYVPLGRLENLEDPRLVRIGNYEDGITGCHDVEKVLTPFIESILERGAPRKIGVLLQGTDSLNKICQTMLEMVRGGIQALPNDVAVYYNSPETFEPAFSEALPFAVHNLATAEPNGDRIHLRLLRDDAYDYVILFDSSGMYRGEDIVNLASFLNQGRLDAVWGSRRLSVKDIHASYKLRYRHKIIVGAISYLGSHLLSLFYLLFYGRYISDTLSGVKAIRTVCLHTDGLDLKNSSANQQLLSVLLRRRAEILETPIQFFPLAPEKVKRTTTPEGLRSLFAALWWRFKPLQPIPTVRKADPAQPAARNRPYAPAAPTEPMPSGTASSSR